MLRRWMLGGLGGLLLTASAWAGLGTVKTRDGQVFTGNIAEQGDQVVVERKGIKTTISRKEIRSIAYANSIEQEYRRRLEQLTPYDMRARLQLAQWLFENKAYGLTMEVLSDTRQLRPHDPDIYAMMQTVDRQVLMEDREARKHAPEQLASADKNAHGTASGPGAGKSGQPTASRLLTPEEINEVKQAEWEQGQPVRVRFLNDVRRKYIAREGLDPAVFNRIAPPQQAWAIVQHGTDDMRRDVILGDPPVMTRYKVVQRSIVAGCANCHSQNKPSGGFALHLPIGNEAATYTNFLILQKYSHKVGDKTYRMLDRQRPEDSLLVQFALPPGIGDPPHPEAANYSGVARTRNDPRLRATIAWITSLNPIAPDYSDIDVGGTGQPPAPQPKGK